MPRFDAFSCRYDSFVKKNHFNIFEAIHALIDNAISRSSILIPRVLRSAQTMSFPSVHVQIKVDKILRGSV